MKNIYKLIIAAAAFSASTAIYADIPVNLTIDNQTGKTIPSSSVSVYTNNIQINGSAKRDYPVGYTTIQMTIQNEQFSGFHLSIGNHDIAYVAAANFSPSPIRSCYDVNSNIWSQHVYDCFYAPGGNVGITGNGGNDPSLFNVNVTLT